MKAFIMVLQQRHISRVLALALVATLAVVMRAVVTSEL